MRLGFHHGIIAATMAFAAVTAATTAASAADAFKDRTINVIVGFGPGGGYDAYGRLLAQHLGQHIPGKPTIVVQNMPGAASLKAVQYLQTNAPNDGTAIVIFNFGQITNSLVEPPKSANVDFRDFAWVGSMNRDVSVCYAWKERFPTVKTPLDLAKHNNVNYGLTGVGSASYFNQMMLIGVFDVPIRQIKGYSSSKEKQIAIERGELDGDCGEWSSVPEDWLRDGKVQVMVRYSRQRSEGMPADIPYAGDIAPTEERKQIVKLLTLATEMGRPFITRKDVPQDRLAILRKAFDETMKDPQLLADAKKQGREISPMPAHEVEEALQELYSLPPNVVKSARDMLTKAD